jgi:hypothetical protein
MAAMGLFKASVSSKAHKANRSESRPVSYRGVEIRCSEDACEAAKAERGKRYLSKEAPTFPLSGCDRREGCGCRYSHLEDRRDKEDRRSVDPLSTRGPAAERRNKADRRAEVKAEDPTVTEAPVSLDPLDDTYYGFRRR